jgi:hypothetical protein
MYIPGRVCEKCQKEIGRENYTLIADKITKGLHHFHATCAPKDPDVQRNHGMTLDPGKMGIIGGNLGRV